MTEYEKRAREYLFALGNLTADLSLFSKEREDDYLKGYVVVMDGAYRTIKRFLEEDDLRKEYARAFKEMRNEYHRLSLKLISSEDTDFNSGQFQAAVDLDKGLDNVVQDMAGWELDELHKRQREERKGIRR